MPRGKQPHNQHDDEKPVVVRTEPLDSYKFVTREKESDEARKARQAEYDLWYSKEQRKDLDKGDPDTLPTG